MTTPRHCAHCGKIGVFPSLLAPIYKCMHCGRSMTPAGLLVVEPRIWSGMFLKQELQRRK